MDLKTYLRSLPTAEREPFAKRCGVELKQLRNIISGRVCSPELAINIERESNGAIRVETLAPVAKSKPVDWAYIRGTRRNARRASRASI